MMQRLMLIRMGRRLVWCSIALRTNRSLNSCTSSGRYSGPPLTALAGILGTTDISLSTMKIQRHFIPKLVETKEYHNTPKITSIQHNTPRTHHLNTTVLQTNLLMSASTHVTISSRHTS